jgi:hypothetical protein
VVEAVLRVAHCARRLARVRAHVEEDLHRAGCTGRSRTQTRPARTKPSANRNSR